MDEIKLSKHFIETELPKAPPLSVCIYLMTLSLGESSAAVAEKLNISESDVLRAWAYWKDRGFLKAKPAPKEPAPRPLPSARRPEYSTQELQEYQKHPAVKHLFASASQMLGRFLSVQDMNLLLGLHEWLGLPMDVILLLLSYCLSSGKKGMGYIEKVGISWAEEGIDTMEKATDYIALRKTGYKAILRAIGKEGSFPVPTQEAYIKKWTKEYGFSVELICDACERTVMQTGKSSFPYADTILTRWHEQNVRTKEDVHRLDDAFNAKKKQEQAAREAQKPQYEQKPRQNRFINYTQSDWDFEELERLEREQRKKW